jgi:aspartyl-tRNA(Asn)/glutamyl-tRNA(Gln) amidotransferase subunit B
MRQPGTAAKSLLRQLLDSSSPSNQDIRAFAEELSLLSVPLANGSDLKDQLRTLCADVVASMPEEVAAIREGKVNVVNKLVGKVMKLSGGKADAKAARETLLQVLKIS